MWGEERCKKKTIGENGWLICGARRDVRRKWVTDMWGEERCKEKTIVGQ